jgi:hypothetical protein
MQTTVTLKLSESGRILRLLAPNNRIIAEILVHGPLAKIVQNCVDNKPILRGRANVYRGELYGLTGYEILNIEQERIEER